MLLLQSGMVGEVAGFGRGKTRTIGRDALTVYIQEDLCQTVVIDLSAIHAACWGTKYHVINNLKDLDPKVLWPCLTFLNTESEDRVTSQRKQHLPAAPTVPMMGLHGILVERTASVM